MTAAWPDLDLAFLDRLPVIPATKARLDARRKASAARRSLAGDHPRPARRRCGLRHRRVGAQAARLHARRHGHRQVDPDAQHDRPGHAGRPGGDLDRSAWRPLGEGAEAGSERAAQRPRAGASDRRARRLHHEHPRAARRRHRERARPHHRRAARLPQAQPMAGDPGSVRSDIRELLPQRPAAAAERGRRRRLDPRLCAHLQRRCLPTPAARQVQEPRRVAVLERHRR